MKPIDDIYKEILLKIYNEGQDVKPRGMNCKELINETIILDPYDNIITLENFETNKQYAYIELSWYISGKTSIRVNPLIEKIWTKFSDDGINVNSAYGYYFFKQKTPTLSTQWDWIVDELKNDPDSRRCVFNINNISHKYNTKDMPCTLTCQVMVRDDKLIWITNMRSNDIYYGFRNDIYCFTEIQKRLAVELNLEAGLYYHNAASLHLYEKEYEKVKCIQ